MIYVDLRSDLCGQTKVQKKLGFHSHYMMPHRDKLLFRSSKLASLLNSHTATPHVVALAFVY